ncbi:MAG: MFS transporter, partial [Bacilli bacterium]|nr:MFS transporter [Bacilli bacterium]
MKLNYKKVFLVGLAFFLISMFWQAYDNVISKTLIDKFGLNQTWSGVVMAFDNVLALFLLPLFGAISDKTNSKLGRRTPFIIIGTVVAAFAFMTMSFMDNYQTTKIENETAIVADYTSIEGQDLTVSEWDLIVDNMATERTTALANSEITDKQYDDWNENVYTEMQTIIADNAADDLSEFETRDLKDYYYQYLSARAWQLTASDPTNFIVFIVVLFVALVAMATFRSPAVALMPDVTIKPLRSKANAIINLMGTIGGLVILVLLMAFGLDKLSYVNYTPAFVTVGILMLVVLAVFLWKVREPKLVEEKEAEEVKFGLTEVEEAKQAGESVEELSKEKKVSLYLILASVFLWFLGYNAVTSKFADYAPKVLEMGYSLPLMIAYAT